MRRRLAYWGWRMTAWARSLLTLAVALAVMLSASTQFVAWAFDQHPALGEPLAMVGGVKLYAPWRVLVWTVAWFAHDVWRALLHVALLAMSMLAAFGLAALVSAIEPMSVSLRLWRPGFARWGKLSQGGLLRGDGLALGAVRRHALTSYDLVRARSGHALMLGAPVHTDDALLAAMASWRGALVLVEARDLASRLPRSDALRFAPGRADALAINPLLAMRGGVHAWSDALTFARGFLRTDDGWLVACLAALMLDTLAHAPAAARSLSGLRQALADPQARLAAFCARWAERAESDLGPATGELTRVARHWRRDGEAALRTLREIDASLRLFADGDHALAVEGHQLRFADLVAGDGPSALVMQMPPGKEKLTASLVSGLLAQLVSACAAASDRDHLGRAKNRDLLIVIEAHALAALAVDAAPPANAQWAVKKKEPWFDAAVCGACERGVRLLLQTPCARDAGAAIGADDDNLADELRDAFAAIAVFGPQTAASAQMAAALAGQVRAWRRWTQQPGRLSRWLFPYWERADAWVAAPEALQCADAGAGLLLIKGVKPIRCRTLIADRASPAFVHAASLPPAPCDWDAPPLAPAPLNATAPLVALSPQSDQAQTPLNPPIASAKLRRALARRAAPALTCDKPDTGERLI